MLKYQKCLKKQSLSHSFTTFPFIFPTYFPALHHDSLFKALRAGLATPSSKVQVSEILLILKILDFLFIFHSTPLAPSLPSQGSWRGPGVGGVRLLLAHPKPIHISPTAIVRSDSRSGAESTCFATNPFAFASLGFLAQ